MSNLITRSTKGSALTHNQMDTNLKKAAQAKTGAYTVVEGDNRDTIECSGTFSVTLPDAAAIVAAADTGDFEVTILNSGSGTITVARTTGADTIDGTAANITLVPNAVTCLKVNQAGNGYHSISGLNSGLGASQFIRSDANDTTTGNITMQKTAPVITLETTGGGDCEYRANNSSSQLASRYLWESSAGVTYIVHYDTPGGAATAQITMDGSTTTIDTGNFAVSNNCILNGTAPASAGATGTAGTIIWDADYIYICTATNTWKRAAIATW